MTLLCVGLATAKIQQVFMLKYDLSFHSSLVQYTVESRDRRVIFYKMLPQVAFCAT